MEAARLHELQLTVMQDLLLQLQLQVVIVVGSRLALQSFLTWPRQQLLLCVVPRRLCAAACLYPPFTSWRILQA